MAKKNKKPKLPKINLEAGMPRPGPISLSGPKRIIESARQYTFLGCWIMRGWKEAGLAPVVVARNQDRNQVIFGVFLVDLYCLGIKNALCNANFSRRRFEQNLPKLCSGDPEPIDAGFTHELIYGSIAYAARWGFQPHPDYKLASHILEPEGTSPQVHDVEFGKDGKPFYVSGPYDNPQKILNQLRKTAGEGNFLFMLRMG